MTIKTKSSSEMERNNRVAMYAHLIEVVIMDIMILAQAFRSGTGITSAVIISIIGIAPVIALPMIFVVSLYNEFRLMFLVNFGVILESIIAVILGAKTGGYGYLGTNVAAIQITTVVITGVYACVLALTTKANAQQKVDNISEAKEKSEELLHEISEMSATLQNGMMLQVKSLKVCQRPLKFFHREVLILNSLLKLLTYL